MMLISFNVSHTLTRDLIEISICNKKEIKVQYYDAYVIERKRLGRLKSEEEI